MTRQHQPFLAAVLTAGLIFVLTPTLAWSVVIKTSDGQGADTELREDESTTRGGAKDLNTRWEASPLNLEVIALRFELGGIDPALIANASLNMIVTRTGMPGNNGVDVYGLNPEVSGQDWVEGTANGQWNDANPFPGLTHDGDLATFPINSNETTYAGSAFWSGAPLQGETVTIDSSSLTSFLHEAGDLVTLFVFRNSPTGTQMRFTSKETVSLGETGTSEPFGTGEFAPWLEFDVLPPAATNIYKWEYVDPADPGLGKQQSSRLAPDGYRLDPQPGLDASSKNLKMAYLIGENLQAASFTSAKLTNADLSLANLNGAAFESAELTGAIFDGADVRQARFGFSNFSLSQLYTTASYQEQDLSGIGLAGANLSGADFANQNLSNADLSSIDLTDAVLTNADLSGAHVSFTNFHNAGLTLDQLYSTASYQNKFLYGIGLAGHDLSDADFSNQGLSSANLAATNIGGADFTGATIDYVNFNGAGMTLTQLYSTASYASKFLGAIGLADTDLTNADLSEQYMYNADLTSAILSHANLANAFLYAATLSGTDLTGAEVRGANFGRDTFAGVGGITPEQLYSTVSYQARDLTGIQLSGNVLSDANLTGQDFTGAYFYNADLTGADFSHSNLSNAYFYAAALSGADLAGAEVRGASFERDTFTGAGGITPEQLYATASHQARDLSGIGLGGNLFSGANLAVQNLTGASFFNADLADADLSHSILTNANFYSATLSGADLTGAEVRGAGFGRDTFAGVGGITLDQLYATASHQAHDLSGIGLSGNFLSGANLTAQNLTDAALWEADLTAADLSRSNLARAYLYGAHLSSANLTHARLTGTYLGNASLFNADLSAADTRGALDSNFDGAVTENLIWPDGHVHGFELQAGQTFDVHDFDGDTVFGAVGPIPIHIDEHFTAGPGSALKLFFDGDQWNSTISFAAGIPVTLGGTLELLFAPGNNTAEQVGRTFQLFDWTGVEPMGEFQLVSSPYAWNLSRLYTHGEVTLIPEPSSLALLALALQLAACRRRPSRGGQPTTRL